MKISITQEEWDRLKKIELTAQQINWHEHVQGSYVVTEKQTNRLFKLIYPEEFNEEH